MFRQKYSLTIKEGVDMPFIKLAVMNGHRFWHFADDDKNFIKPNRQKNSICLYLFVLIKSIGSYLLIWNDLANFYTLDGTVFIPPTKYRY